MTKIEINNQKIQALLARNVVEVITAPELENKLKQGKKLRIKLGADPSRPDLHLGHAVALRKLREFQDLGHQVVFIIGDYTGMIGDPSGKSKTRPQLSESEVKKNAKSYLAQVGKVLDVKKAEIRFNSEWFAKMKFAEVIKLTSQFTAARVLERDDFTKRWKAGIDIGLHELLYPTMQAYDSVMVKADVEMGGTDQVFNMLAGRMLQKRLGQAAQVVMTVPLLIGLEGKEKMSKSLDNYVGLTDLPEEMYGKIMSIADGLILPYFEYCTTLPLTEIAIIKQDLAAGQNPKVKKMFLAYKIVELYYNTNKAIAAEEYFRSVHEKKEIPQAMTVVTLTKKDLGKDREINIIKLLALTKLAKSNSEAKRLLDQGGIKDGETVVKDYEAKVVIKENGTIIQRGKRQFVRVICK
ncbi:MAG: tyrosine--tRNA ligase [Candidatus Buchananbacteria bacterium]